MDEPLFATASIVPRWIFLEQPGPWGHHALVQNRLPPGVAAGLVRRSRSSGVRLVLIRRPSGSRGGVGDPPACFTADSSPGRVGLWRVPISRPGDLLDLDWARLTAAGPEGAAGLGAVRESEPLFLVCTNGARDVCCAERGRPLVRTLRAAVGDRAWECSHIGGDRFAGNLVCFPHGMYFGRLTPSEAVSVARAYAEGRVDLPHYRGRSSLGFAEQAAEHAVRVRTGLVGVDDVRITGVRRWEGGGGLDAEFEAELEAGPAAIRVSLRTSRASPPRPLTCKSAVAVRPPGYQVASIGPGDAGPPASTSERPDLGLSS